MCEGKVRSLITDRTSIRYIDQTFQKAVNWAGEDFGQPSVLTSERGRLEPVRRN